MCIICLDWEKGKLTNKEAFRAIGEILNTSKKQEEKTHLWDLIDQIMEVDVPSGKVDDELDIQWHKETHDEDT